MKRKRKNSFDIDHIVIPYSMPSTRVEKPKYKVCKIKYKAIKHAVLSNVIN